MSKCILYSIAAALVGSSAWLAWFGFMHQRLPDQAMAIILLAAGMALAVSALRIDHLTATQ